MGCSLCWLVSLRGADPGRDPDSILNGAEPTQGAALLAVYSPAGHSIPGSLHFDLHGHQVIRRYRKVTRYVEKTMVCC